MLPNDVDIRIFAALRAEPASRLPNLGWFVHALNPSCEQEKQNLRPHPSPSCFIFSPAILAAGIPLRLCRFLLCRDHQPPFRVFPLQSLALTPWMLLSWLSWSSHPLRGAASDSRTMLMLRSLPGTPRRWVHPRYFGTAVTEMLRWRGNVASTHQLLHSRRFILG